MKNKTLHRNFMGYTAGKTELMIGLGMSSISDSWHAFAQNEKSVKDYTNKVIDGIIPIFRGHLLNSMDLIIRKNILDLMCNLETKWNTGMDANTKKAIINRLSEMIEDGFVERVEDRIIVKEQGRMFVRNICMAFDIRLIENKPETRIFSMTI